MAGTDQLLFKIDTLVLDGVALPIEDGTGVLSGAAGWENTVVPSASGDDFNSRKRVPRLMKARLQFGPGFDADALANANGVQLAVRDSYSGRKAILHNCSFGSMGDVGGGGPVDVVFNVLSPVEWV
jgi:hypothetical protein